MNFALCSLFLLCGISGLLNGARSHIVHHQKAGVCCPYGWTRLDERCLIFQDEARDFADAESICNILGGNLVSIHSALENSVVVQLNRAGTTDSSVDVWIGFHEAILEGDFIWTDGSPVDFTNFNSDNDSGDCVAIENDDVLWDLDDCDDNNKYVCAKEVPHYCGSW